MYHFATSTTSDASFRQHLQAILRLHNQRVSSVRGPDAQSLIIRVADADGRIVGGLVALIYWNWLVIDVMAVEADVRGQGLGKQLLLRTEELARAQGCRHAHTST